MSEKTPPVTEGSQVRLPKLERDGVSPANRRRLSTPGLRSFLAISDVWGLGAEERRSVLGLPARSTYYKWVKAAREQRDITLGVDTLTRISAVLGIHQALRILNASEAESVAWLHTLHNGTVFTGRAPLALIVSGSQDELFAVLRFLDAARGGLYMPPSELEREFFLYRDAEIVFS